MKHHALLVQCLFVIPLLSLVGCSEPQTATETVRPVNTLTVKSLDHFLSASFPSRAEPVREVNLAFEVNGTLQKLPVKVGDEIKQGDLLAQLNQKSFSARLAATQARYRKAVNDERRLKKLLVAGNASQTQYDDAQTNLDVLESQLALDKKALADTTLRAPFDGLVVAVYLDNYTFVPASTQVVRLIDISQIEMWVDLPEQFAVLSEQVADYQVRVKFDAYPDRIFDADVKEWGREASRENRTFPFGLVIDQPEDITILPGMSGVAFAETQGENIGIEDPIEVPAGAIFTLRDQTQSSVWVVKDDHVVLQPVKVRSISREVVLIEGGLTDGDEIVVAGVHSLQEGQKIRRLNSIQESVSAGARELSPKSPSPKVEEGHE
ncbi:efflux RND transporter periplasmic adaptor subunit [Maricurvus nonylphenolicus]|uniref:efflux RND transporter periplasmic adaptor subunit n=1 Tax=Maricurvus nonylphenolicus TaxID=1008307 RepID=UPI0036F21344